MNDRERLRQLDELLNEPGLSRGFPSQEACLDWASKVAPLLKSDPNYHGTFLAHLQRLAMPLSASSQGASLRIMIAQAKMAANDLRATSNREPMPDEVAKAGNPRGAYVHPDRLSELQATKHTNFDLTKLLRLLEELDLSFRTGCYLATAMLVRSILDHVPPIFGVGTFAAVANNYSGSKSFRDSMLNLENSSRKIADQHVHGQIRESETLPTARQVDFSPDIDVLLAEICSGPQATMNRARPKMGAAKPNYGVRPPAGAALAEDFNLRLARRGLPMRSSCRKIQIENSLQ
jgi:hypothetical protein